MEVKDKEKPKKLMLRAKSLKITVGSEFTATVIDAACYLTKQLNDLSTFIEQPDVTAMRAALMPAYKIIASALGKFLNIPEMTADRLTGLSVELHPALGTYAFDINYKLDNGQFQPYHVKVSAPDGNVFLRVRAAKGGDAAMEFMLQI